MCNLLSAGFVRLRRSKAFWLLTLGVFLLATGTMLNAARAAKSFTLPQVIENHYFDTGVYACIFFSAFTALFIGTEYSDGALRNKLIVGHSRARVYLANLVVCTVASLLFTAAWMLGGLVGIPALGPFTVGTAKLLTAAAVCALSSVAIGAIFLFLSMLSSNKAITVVLCIFFSLALIVVGSSLYNNLCEPEMSSGMVITVDGLQFADPTPNPRYVAEPLRSVLAVILNILPTGQLIMLANIADGSGFAIYPLQLAGSAVLAILLTGIGLALFRRKDLK